MEEAYTFDDVLLKPKKGVVESRSQVNLSSQLLNNDGEILELELPILAAPMDTVVNPKVCKVMDQHGALGILHRFQTIKEQCEEAKKAKELGTQNLGAAIGLKDWKERTKALAEVDVNIFVLDVAHGHHENVIKTVKEFKQEFDHNLIVGNIATKQAAKDLIKAGADCLKIGIGPGASCSTRIVTGCGVPQITAIQEVSEVAKKHDIPTIADGGIKNSGDMVKALAAGADTVMIGSLVAGCEEAPGDNDYRGMASMEANEERLEKMNPEEKEEYLERYTPEGVSGEVKKNGSLNHLLKKLAGGMKSGVSYLGAKDIKGLKQNAEFVKITNAGMRKSQPHLEG